MSLRIRFYETYKNAQRWEREIHKALRKRKVSGEWFELPTIVAERLVAVLNDLHLRQLRDQCLLPGSRYAKGLFDLMSCNS